MDFCILGLKGGLKDRHSWMVVHEFHTSRHTHLHTLLIYEYVYTTLTACKTPHLAQTDQAKMVRFLALPDSNTSPRVTISVLGHVAVSQACMTQTPYLL